MKKHLMIGVLVLGCVSMASAAIVTNLNQSAQYFRLLSRNASTDIDAVYYNPAGLTRLTDGFHVAFYNQTVFQQKTVTNSFPLLNDSKYEGDITVPIYPDVYAVYKQGPLVLSFGFGPNAGGGTVKYDKGLPSFEYQISALPALLTSMGLPTSNYSADIYLEGGSIYYGFQVNASYAFDDIFSAALGIRYVYAVNNIKGHLLDIMLNPNFAPYGLTGQMLPAPVIFTTIGQPAYAAMTSDQEVEVKQTGSGFTPILSLNVHPIEGLNISAKYEFNTKIELTNKTTKDITPPMFPDGAKTHNDIPAILSFGVEYALMPELRASVSFNYFFDKNANWDGREKLVDSNSYDLGIGLEYDVTKTVAVSVGYLRTQYGLSADYLEDQSFELSSNSFALGARIRLTDKLDLDVGGLLASYQDASKTISYVISNVPFGSYPEKYQETTAGFAIGLGYRF
jgi:long-chain fatty acid transport protein